MCTLLECIETHPLSCLSAASPARLFLPPHSRPPSGDVHKSYCLSSQRVSKFKESESLANVVHIYMAVIRLKSVTTDLLVSFNVPTSFAHGSSSDGRAILQADENRAVIQGVLKTLAIKDWGLFGQ